MPKLFASESDLCAAFMAEIVRQQEHPRHRGNKWVAYAETAGWDILLVREDGFQIGIEAKLVLNAHVISQALPGSRWSSEGGPDVRAVLVPEGGGGHFQTICDFIGISIIRIYPVKGLRTGGYSFSPALPEIGRDFGEAWWWDQCTLKRHDLPEYVPDVVAGASAPVQLTYWKIKAIKVSVLLEKQGYLTRQDFKHLQFDSRRWTVKGSEALIREGQRYVRGRFWPDFRLAHPKNYAEIEADFERWRPKDPLGLKEAGK